MAALDLLAAAAPFVGGAAGGPIGAGAGSLFSGLVGGDPAAAVAAPPPSSTATSSAAGTTQSQTTTFGSAFVVGGGSAGGVGERPATQLLSAGGVPWLTLALIGGGVLVAVLLLRR